MPPYHFVHAHKQKCGRTRRRIRATLTFSQTPESSMMANLRENKHFSCVLERQVWAFRSQTRGNINHLCLHFSYCQMAKALAYWRWPWWWLFPNPVSKSSAKSQSYVQPGPFFSNPLIRHIFLCKVFIFSHPTIWNVKELELFLVTFSYRLIYCCWFVCFFIVRFLCKKNHRLLHILMHLVFLVCVGGGHLGSSGAMWTRRRKADGQVLQAART